MAFLNPYKDFVGGIFLLFFLDYENNGKQKMFFEQMSSESNPLQLPPAKLVWKHSW
jgi:hypothetical protein